MSCAVCYGPIIGLKTVKCGNKPCSAVYCSDCWSEMDERHKIRCMLCTQKFPGVLNRQDKYAINFRLVIIVLLFSILIVWYPSLSFEQVEKCHNECKNNNKHGYINKQRSNDLCEKNTKLCETLHCSLGCLDIETVECYAAEKICRMSYVDNNPEKFIMFAIFTAIATIAGFVDIYNFRQNIEVLPGNSLYF